MPIIKVQEVILPVPAAFLNSYPNPPIPSSGDNLVLLEWAQECAVNNRLYETQLQHLKEAQ